MPDMAGTTDLGQLLRTLEPVRRDGEFVYATVVEVPAGLPVEAMVREPEGLTVVVRRDAADIHGIRYDYVAAWITLTVHSSRGRGPHRGVRDGARSRGHQRQRAGRPPPRPHPGGHGRRRAGDGRVARSRRGCVGRAAAAPEEGPVRAMRGATVSS